MTFGMLEESNVEYAILQLSDLHIFDNTEWNVMQRAYERLPYKSKIKCIVITGDLHQFGDDYSKTSLFLENILKFYELSKKDIFIVPGNHDAEPFEDKKVYAFYIENHIETDPDCYVEYFIEGKMIDSFKKYNQFIKDFYCNNVYEHPEQIHVFNWNDKINFICLNTAINCNGDNTLKQIIDIRKLSDFSSHFNSKMPSIILAHHSIEYIHRSHLNLLKSFITDWNVSAYLCGDAHIPSCTPIMTHNDAGKNIPCIVCGKSAPEYGDDYSVLGCIIYLKEMACADVQTVPFEWNNVTKNFSPSNMFNSYSGYHHFPLLNSNVDLSITEILIETAKRINRKSYTEGRFVNFNAALKDNISFIDMPEISNLIKGDDDDCPTKLINLLNNDKTTNGFLLVGKGGCGKTFMLLDIVKKFNDGEFDNSIPIYIALNELNKFNDSEHDDIIMNYFISKIKENFSNIDVEAIKDWLREEWTSCENNYPLLLLDGFNEITSETVNDNVVFEIRKLQVNYPRIRFVITCRYNISMRFTIGGSALLPFKGKEVQPLSKEYVEMYTKKCLGNIYCDGEINNKIYDAIQRPMALIMYIKSRKRENEGYELRHSAPQTLGEILDNYVTVILNSKPNGLNRETNSKLLKLIYFIGYRMNCDGHFEITNQKLNNYLQEGVLWYGFNEVDTDNLFELPIINDVLYVSENDSKLIHFYHQDFRDYFCAKFLENIILEKGKDKITEIFKKKIPKEVLVLLADIIGEYKFRPESHYNCDECYSLIQQTLFNYYKGRGTNDDAVAASQLIDVVRCGRENSLGGFDFSEIDLTQTSLNNCKLYYIKDGMPVTADFTKTILSDYTFLSMGHSAAIYTMCQIKNRYVISFSIESIWCYDTETRIQYKIANIEGNTPITASAHFGDNNLITGNKKGTLTVWNYEIKDNKVAISYIKSFSVQSNIRGIRVTATGNKRICLFSTEDGRVFYYSPEMEEALCFFKYVETYKIAHPLYIGELMSINNNKIYVVFGKDVFCLDIPRIGEKMIISSDVEPYYTWNDEDISFIYDIIVVNWNRKNLMLLNGRPTRRTDGKYKILEVITGELEKVILENIIGSGKKDKDFRGFSSFAKGLSDDEIFVGVNCISSFCPNLYRFNFTVDDPIPTIMPIMGAQTMSIEFSIPIYITKEPYKEKGLITCSADRSIQILCLDERRENVDTFLPGHYNGVHALDIIYENDESTIYVGQYSGALSSWVKQGDQWISSQVYLLHSDWLWDVKHYIHNGNIYLFTCSYDHTVSIVNAKTEEVICIIRKNDKIIALNVLPNGNLIITYHNCVELIEILYDDKSYRSMPPFIPSPNTSCRALANVSDGILIATFVQNSSNSVIYKASVDNNIIKRTQEKNFEGKIIRCISVLDFVEEEIIALGGTSCDTNLGDFISVCYGEKKQEISIVPEISGSAGISSVCLSEYNGRIYLGAASYISCVYLFSIDLSPELKISPICCLGFDNQLLDVKIIDGDIYVASLSGNVFGCSLNYILQKNGLNVENWNGKFSGISFINMSDKILFHTVSGFAMNNVDFSSSEKSWSKETCRLIEQYAITE